MESSSNHPHTSKYPQPSPRKWFLRHPIFWTIFLITSFAAGIISYLYFSTAIPLVDLKISMNRAEAFQKAGTLAKRYQLGPSSDFRKAAYFNTDSDTQNFIELERGGSAAWKAFLQEGGYHPYTWIVRHFKEGETNEVFFQFTPDGTPYGFTEIIAETDRPGEALTAAEARAIVEDTLKEHWKIDINSYKLKDSRKEARSTGRVDHTFIYEKELKNLGDAHYLLTVVMAGNKITTINHSIDIPESFTRSFKNIRALNDTIYYVASVLMYILYLFLGCLGAILVLLKKKWLLPKQALYAGFGLAFLHMLSSLNQFPIVWFSYDTALQSQTFLFQNFLSMFIQSLTLAILYTTTFVAAEGLTRLAFGGHVQLWSAWKLPAASTYLMLGKTITGYFIVALHMGFVVLSYAIGMRYLGWWSPSAALTDPNILSTYIPALGVFANSLSAGFWEECLFRAIPIAACALIGRKIGYPKTALVIGLVIQPLIFGAAHANYPSLPSYVRILELYLPFLGFGLIYVLFGLIPVIIAHTIFDAILFSLPIFVSDAPGMLFQRILIIIGCALPLLVVLYSRLRTGRWVDMPDAFFNGAWKPATSPFIFEKEETEVIHAATRPFSAKKMACIIAVGLLSITLWTLKTSFGSSLPKLITTKSQAKEGATTALKEKNITLDPGWQTLSSIYSPVDDAESSAQHLFIWQNYGEEAYNKLLGNYLTTPAWGIRFAQFEGDLQKRAEEFQFRIGNAGVIRDKHILPQVASGEKIDQNEARTIALQFIADKYKLQSQNIQEIAAQSEALPNRVDWHFTFAQPGILSEKQTPNDLARINIAIAGDRIVDAEQIVHIPEDWSRAARMRQALTDCIGTLRRLAWFLVIMLGGLLAAMLWYRGQLQTKKMLIAAGIYAVGSFIVMILNFPQTLATFTTAQPIFLQTASYFLLEGAKIIFDSLTVGILAGIILSTKVISALTADQKIIAGLVAGSFWLATLTAIHTWVYPSVPWFATLNGANATLPFIVFVWRFLAGFVKQTLYGQVLAYSAIDSRWRSILALATSVFLFTPYETAGTLFQWITAATLMTCMISLLYIFIIRAQPKVVPLLFAVPFLGILAKEYAAHAFPGSSIIWITTAAIILLIAFKLAEGHSTNK